MKIDEQLQEISVDGKKISPVLPEEVKNYMIDIDGTICDDIPNEEPERMATAALYPDALETINNSNSKKSQTCLNRMGPSPA